MTTTNSSVNTLNLEQSLILNGLSEPLKDNIVYLTGQGQKYLLDDLLNIMNSKIPNETRWTNQPEFQWGKAGSQEVYSIVTTTPTLTGVELAVTVVDSNGFRLTDTVMDVNTATTARIVGISGNILTLRAVGSTALNASTMFQSGSRVRMYGNAQISKGSAGRENLNWVPNYFTEYTQIMRESNSMYREDMVKTYPQFNGQYWWFAQDKAAIARYRWQEKETMFWGDKGKDQSGTAQQSRTTSGLRQRIIQDNPELYMPLTSLFTKQDFDDMLTQFVIKNGIDKKVFCIMGAEARARFQDVVITPQVQYVGKLNTFDGEELKGYNAHEYSYNGVDIVVMSGAEFFDEEGIQIPSAAEGATYRWSNTILFCDLSPIWSADLSMYLPPIVKRYFAPREGQPEFISTYLRGMIELPTSGVSTASVYNMMYGAAQGASPIISDIDQYSFQIYCDRGYQIFAEKFGLMELTV